LEANEIRARQLNLSLTSWFIGGCEEIMRY